MRLSRFLLVATLAAGLAGAAFAEDAVGAWSGQLMRLTAPVPIEITFSKGADGKLTGVARAPSGEVPLINVVSDGANLSFDAPAIPGHFNGRWNPASKSWEGALKQKDGDLALSFFRTAG